jgi:hypothetical protein
MHGWRGAEALQAGQEQAGDPARASSTSSPRAEDATEAAGAPS